MTSTTHNGDAHLSLDDIALLLDGDGDDVMRAHLRSCSACAALLEKEAKADEDVSALPLTFCPGCDRAHERDAHSRCTFCGVAFAPGGFVVERVLAESDHGRLYLARNPEGELVALKEIVFARVPDVEALDRFEREARLLKQLRHARIPRYLASFSEGEGVHLRLYLAQRYVDGPSLDEELETKRFTEDDARAIAGEVLTILADLQALSPPVIHRDVKPANLVRDSDGKLALVDFGSARDVQKTMGGTLVGTFGYMPVEQLSGVVDESTDVYALGATLLHLLTRRPPWESQSNNGAFTMSNVAVSPGFRRFLAACLAARDRRFANARAALAGLHDVDRRRAWPAGVIVASLATALVAAGGVTAVAWEHAQAQHALVAPPSPPSPPTPPTPPMPPVPPMPPGAHDVDPNGPEAPKLMAAHDPVTLRAKVNDDDERGTLDLACTQPCAVTIDGTLHLTSPVTSELSVGKHDIVVSSPTSKHAEHAVVTIEAGKTETYRYDLDAATSPATPPPPPQGALKKHYSGKRITIDLQDADLENVVRMIGDISRKNLVLNVGDRKMKVTMTFKNTPWDEALDELAKAYRLVVEENGDTITVRPDWRTETPRAAP